MNQQDQQQHDICLDFISKQSEEESSSSVSLWQHEKHVQQQPFSVAAWCEYLDAVDDLILSQQQQLSSTQPALSNNAPKKRDRFLEEQDDAVLLLVRDFVGKRAVKQLPRSYKLWKIHWEFVVEYYSRKKKVSEPTPQSGNISLPFTADYALDCLETALWTLHAMPRVWLVYFELVLGILEDLPTMGDQSQQDKILPWPIQEGRITITSVRRAINRAMQALPVSQHSKIWPLLVKKIMSSNDPIWPTSTVQRLWKRYTAYDPTKLAGYAEWCQQNSQWSAAAQAYIDLLNNQQHAGSSPSQPDVTQEEEYWHSFMELCTLHSLELEQAGVAWERILRVALEAALSVKPPRHDQDQSKEKNAQGALDLPEYEPSRPLSLSAGLLYSQLAAAWIRRGAFDLARTVYEEGLQRVITVRDFSILYAAYLQLEEGLLEAATLALEQQEVEASNIMDLEQDQNIADDWDILLAGRDESSPQAASAASALVDMEWALARAEHLTKRRPLLLNAVMLRQNPNNVREWSQRAQLMKQNDDHRQAAAALEEALKTIEPHRAINGVVSQLVVELVDLYDTVMGKTDQARGLMGRVCNQYFVHFKAPEDLAACWSTWVELELRHERWDDALSLARQAVAPVKGKTRVNVSKNLRLWDLLLDLEESLGTVQTAKDAYARALDIKAATVQHVLNYGAFLREQKYFEESFTAYERGIEIFAFPHSGAKLLWKAYLKDFIDRYEGSKVERVRDLFHRCLESCPAEDCAEFFLMNGDFEEKYGLTKRALACYRSMCQKVPKHEKSLAYQLYIAKTTKYMGFTATRHIYQEAIETLPDSTAANFCIDFANMESTLQEPERARAILTHGAQMADPRRLPEYWKAWNDFEIAHGNEETFRDMLRVKRSVEAAFSTVNYNATGMLNSEQQMQRTMTSEEAMRMIAAQEGMDLEELQEEHEALVPEEQHGSGIQLPGFVRSQRKSTGTIEPLGQQAFQTGDVPPDVPEHLESYRGDEEIDIDEIDAEIEAAAAEGATSS